MSTRIKLRRDTNANWTANNPILEQGEAGIVTNAVSDDVKIKIGDGSTAWNALSYFAPGASAGAWGSITGTLSNQTDLQTALNNKQDLDSDLTAIAALGFTSTSFLKKTAANTWALDTNTYLTSSTGVTSVSGTTNRITSTGGTTPVIDIDSSYVGQSSITTLGTITTGTWSATAIGVTKGGTGLTTVAAGSILGYNSADTASAITSTSGLKVLQNSAGTVSWNTTTGTGDSVMGTSPAITTSITTGSITFALVNTTATTLNFAGAATALNIGAATCTTSIASDSDATTTLGRFTVKSNTTDNVYLGHFDHNTSTDYSLLHTSAGATALNAASGQTLTMLIANATKLSLSSSAFTSSNINFTVGSIAADPSTSTDTAKIYSKDITAGNAAIHMISETGAIIKAYRDTGWTLPTGTASKAGFDTSTATLTQVAQTVKAMMDHLMTNTGWFGA